MRNNGGNDSSLIDNDATIGQLKEINDHHRDPIEDEIKNILLWVLGETSITEIARTVSDKNALTITLSINKLDSFLEQISYPREARLHRNNSWTRRISSGSSGKNDKVEMDLQFERYKTGRSMDIEAIDNSREKLMVS